MSLSLSHQGWALLLSLTMGAGIGLLYYILLPARRHSGAALARLLDALFAVTAAAALFFFAMASGNGRLGTWELAAALLGFLLYMHLLSPLLLPPVEKIFRGVGAFLIRLEKLIKKVQNK